MGNGTWYWELVFWLFLSIFYVVSATYSRGLCVVLLLSVSESVGFNEYVVPEVGDLLVIIPVNLAPQWSRYVKCSYNPNFHFAVVVLTDGEHYVTLENWAVNDVDSLNEEWGLCVYGRGPLSYHTRLSASGGYGTVALTYRARFAT